MPSIDDLAYPIEMFASLPVHFIAYSGLFGVTCYQSFFSGIVAYKALPIEMFSKLQHKIFPGYFRIQAILEVILFFTPPFPMKSDGIASVAVSMIATGVNALLVPTVNEIVSAREVLMEKEGKAYKDPTASDEMKALNKKFAKLHGISMLLNLAVILAVFYYGFYFVSRLAIKAI